MRWIWTVAAALSAAALMASSAAAGPAKSQTYYAKITAGGTFTEEAKWDTTVPNFEHDSGNGKFTVHMSASQDLVLTVDHGSVTVSEPRNVNASSSGAVGFAAEGTHVQIGQPQSNDHGKLNFNSSGRLTSGNVTVLDDFDPDGSNLSISLSFAAAMSGVCTDDKFGDKCQDNTANPGVPEVLGGGNPQPLNGKMQVGGGGGFISANSSRQPDNNPTSTNWKGLACHGSLSSGWTCAFSGTRVWTKAPGVTYTQLVSMNARITIVGQGK